jgi:hypothetical protein
MTRRLQYEKHRTGTAGFTMTRRLQYEKQRTSTAGFTMTSTTFTALYKARTRSTESAPKWVRKTQPCFLVSRAVHPVHLLIDIRQHGTQALIILALLVLGSGACNCTRLSSKTTHNRHSKEKKYRQTRATCCARRMCPKKKGKKEKEVKKEPQKEASKLPFSTHPSLTGTLAFFYCVPTGKSAPVVLTTVNVTFLSVMLKFFSP